MSEFKEGQEVIITGDEGSYRHSLPAGTVATVKVVDGSPSTLVTSDGREVWVGNVDLEPAPLDPKSVHVGDTVTVRFKETGEEFTTTAYRPAEVKAPEWVSILGWPLIKADGLLGLAVQYFQILAIEPASEPEPEWKPGTTGTATVAHLAGGTAVLDMRVMRVEWDGLLGFATQTGRIVEDGSTEWSVYDLVPDEPRPLPTRDDLARVMHDDYLPNGEPRLGRTHREILADAVLAHLRGESR